jgi:hypothetical protein
LKQNAAKQSSPIDLAARLSSFSEDPWLSERTHLAVGLAWQVLQKCAKNPNSCQARCGTQPGGAKGRHTCHAPGSCERTPPSVAKEHRRKTVFRYHVLLEKKGGL